ncbi:MAG: O-antigen ligase family protein [Polyangiaceae bacterium]|jgi:hypothetical protein
MLAEPLQAARGPLAVRIARALLIVLAVVLPFEAPLFRVGPLQLTTVELALYAVLAAYGTAVTADVVRHRTALSDAARALRSETMVQAAVLWATVQFASALAAPTDRAAAFKFALRTLSGVLVFFAGRSLARHPETARRLILAILCGALLSAGTAVIDSLVPRSDRLWAYFREGRFTAFGLPRASGVFAYPTIGSMYWEAAVPLLIVAPFVRLSPRSQRTANGGAAITAMGGLLLVTAILDSATRSALVGAALGAAALAALGWNAGVPIRRASAAVMAVIALSPVIPLGTTAFGSLLGQRLRFWHDDAWFGVEYEIDSTPVTAGVGELFAVPIRLRNTGTLTWTRKGEHPFKLSYHWVKPDGEMSLSDFEGRRTDLPMDVPPGGVVQIEARARGPAEGGTYRLRWDLVQEGVTWFSERGNAMADQEVDVTAGAEVSTSEEDEDEAPVPESDAPAAPRTALWRAAVALWQEHPLWGIGPDNFRRRYPAVLSLAPNGTKYNDNSRVHANSFYFETLADLGVIGILALALLMFALGRLLRAHHRTTHLLGIGSGVAAGLFFVHGALDYFLEFTPLFGLYWLLLGLTAACASTPWPIAAHTDNRPSAQTR